MAYSAIDVGEDLGVKGTNGSNNTTYIGKGQNPANASGLLNSFTYYIGASTHTAKIGTFSGSGTSWAVNDYVTIGDAIGDSPQTYTGDNCAVSTNDILGWCSQTHNPLCLNTIGAWESGSDGGDNFGGGSFTYSDISYGLCVYASGITVPDAPTSVSATDNLTDKVTITWTAGTGETDGHRVYRDGADISGVVAHGTGTYDDTSAVAGTTYSYTVKAINAAGLSAASSADNGTRVSSSSFVKGIMKHNYIPALVGGY